jgi:hypothetical protein
MFPSGPIENRSLMIEHFQGAILAQRLTRRLDAEAAQSDPRACNKRHPNAVAKGVHGCFMPTISQRIGKELLEESLVPTLSL